MNLGDPELELIDPTPNIHLLFVSFDKLFFTTTLSNRVVVRWSKRMYSCAGICSYERGSGYCDIALSEPLLKLRPRKDLVETLLHEMIHAYLFITKNDRDRDGHGPLFKAHMHRINRCAGVNISIYHDFIDEVKLYQTHVWRCNGPCQSKRPYFGIIRRTANRTPGPSDYWWSDHKARCTGTFVKIKEPNVPIKKKVASKSNLITNYIPSNNIKNNVPQKNTKPVLKDSNRNIKSDKNKAGTLNNYGYFSPKILNHKPLFNVKGQIIGSNRNRSNSADVVETLRNVWGNKQFPNTKEVVMTSSPDLNPNKHKLELHHLENTPAKIKKIDDYFKATASEVLKDIYGKDIKLTESSDGKKLVAVTDTNLVPCPVCNTRMNKDAINRHLDECLNKDVIHELTKEKATLKQIVGPIPTIPKFKEVTNFKMDNEEIKLELPDSLDSSLVELFNNQPTKRQSGCATAGPSKPVKTVDIRSVVKKLDFNTDASRKSNNFIIPINKKTDVNKKADIKVKIEPGTSKDIIKSADERGLCWDSKYEKHLTDHPDYCTAIEKVMAEVDRLIKSSMEQRSKPSIANNDAIIIDDDDFDIFDESLTLNPTGTKTPCPCCLKMVEQADMNAHLDVCLK